MASQSARPGIGTPTEHVVHHCCRGARRSAVDLQQASTHGRGEGQPHSSKMGASRVTFNPSTTSRGSVVGADLDDGIRESGIPDKVRMPRRYVSGTGSSSECRRELWTRRPCGISSADGLDYPRHGQVDAHDIAIFAEKWCKTTPRPGAAGVGDGPGVAYNGQAAGTRACRIPRHRSFCRGHRRGVPEDGPLLKEVTARPFRDDWIALVKAANNGKVCLPPAARACATRHHY